MSTLSSTKVTGYRCEVDTCDAEIVLAAAEDLPTTITDVSDALRWHAPTTPEFYEHGWVWKRGHSHALTYCATHRGRAMKCTCMKRDGEIIYEKRSCSQHGEKSDVRQTFEPSAG